MQTIEITGATGTGPYDVYICDITLTYCFLISGSTSIPPNVYFELPTSFTNPFPPPVSIGFTETSGLVVKIIDLSSGCEKFIPYYCPSATPTMTPTPTLTSTPSTCLCNRIDNTTGVVKFFTYTNCDGTPDVFGSVPPSGTVFVCGTNVSPVSGLIISINGPCIDNSCPPIYLSSTPTETPTQTPTPTLTPSTTPYFVNREMISCCLYPNEYALIPYTISFGDIVRLSDGTCWTVGNVSATPPTLTFVIQHFGDCTTCSALNPC